MVKKENAQAAKEDRVRHSRSLLPSLFQGWEAHIYGDELLKLGSRARIFFLGAKRIGFGVNLYKKLFLEYGVMVCKKTLYTLKSIVKWDLINLCILKQWDMNIFGYILQLSLKLEGSKAHLLGYFSTCVLRFLL